MPEACRAPPPQAARDLHNGKEGGGNAGRKGGSVQITAPKGPMRAVARRLHVTSTAQNVVDMATARLPRALGSKEELRLMNPQRCARATARARV